MIELTKFRTILLLFNESVFLGKMRKESHYVDFSKAYVNEKEKKRLVDEIGVLKRIYWKADESWSTPCSLLNPQYWRASIWTIWRSSGEKWRLQARSQKTSRVLFFRYAESMDAS